jgi:hypothetical protein
LLALHGGVRFFRLRVLRARPRDPAQEKEEGGPEAGAGAEGADSRWRYRKRFFSLERNGAPVVLVAWRQLDPREPLRDVLVQYQGQEVARFQETTLEFGEYIKLPDGQHLSVQCVPDFLRHRRLVAQIGETDLVEVEGP